MIFRGFYIFFSVREHNRVLATTNHAGMRESKSQLATHEKLPVFGREGMYNDYFVYRICQCFSSVFSSVLEVKGTKYMTIHIIFANFYALKKSEY